MYVKLLTGVYKRVSYSAAAFVLVVSTVTAALPFIVSQGVSAAGWHSVSTVEELKAALLTESRIKLTDNITTAEKLILAKSDVTIDGGGKSITFEGNPAGWQGNYVLQVWNATNVTINSLKLHGGDAGLFVNGSVVKLTGHTNVSNNEYGGIQVGGGKNPANISTLSYASGNAAGNFTFANTTETAAKPTIWTNRVNGEAPVVSGVERVYLGLNGQAPSTQSYYYLSPQTAGVVATNVTTGVVYAGAEAAIDAATAGDTIRLEQDVTLESPTIRVRKSVTIDGNGKIVTTTQSRIKNGVDNAAFIVTANDVAIKNVTTRGIGGGTAAHGVVFQNVTGGSLKDVRFENGAAGVIINGSVVYASGITTVDNNWYGINVDKAGAHFTISGASSHNETVAIFTEKPALVKIEVPVNAYALVNSGGAYRYYRDLNAPNTTLVVGSETGYVNGKTVIKGTASDDVRLSRVLVQMIGKGRSSEYTKTIHLSGQVEADWSLKLSDFSTNIAEGEYSIHVSVTDHSGKTTRVGGWERTAVFDKQGPVATVSLPSAGGAYNINDLKLIVAASDESELRRIDVSIYDETDTVRHAIWGDWISGVFLEKDYSGDLRANLAGLEDGKTYVFRATVADAAGNAVNAMSVRFTIDNTAPIVTLNGDNSITIEQGSEYIENYATTDDGTSVVIAGSVDTGVIGEYVITYTATDAAGNSTTVSRVVTVVAPAVDEGTTDPTDPTEPPVDPVTPLEDEEEQQENRNNRNTLQGGTPARLATPAVLGTSTGIAQIDTRIPAVEAEDDDTGVQGATTDKAAQAVSGATDAEEQGSWYWWIIGALAVIILGWWIIAAAKKRKKDEE